MRFVALLQAAQDRDRVGDRRLAHEDRLEAPLERGVLLDLLAVLVERGCADGAQLAAREHRLEEVARADTAPSAAPAPTIVCSSSMKRMIRPSADWISFSTAFSRSSNSPLYFEPARSAPMSSAQTRLPLRPSGHVAGDDALRQSFDDRRLADSRVADQDGVVLRAARQHLDHTADFLVSPDHRVELALLGRGGEVAAELLERLVGLFRILRGDALASAHRLDLRLELIARHDVQCEQEVLGRDVVVLHALRFVGGLVEDARERGRDVRLLLHPLDGRLRAERCFGLQAELGRVGHELLRQLLVEEREQQVLRVELGVAHPARKLLRRRDGLLALESSAC